MRDEERNQKLDEISEPDAEISRLWRFLVFLNYTVPGVTGED